jgi:hypothetical protein
MSVRPSSKPVFLVGLLAFVLAPCGAQTPPSVPTAPGVGFAMQGFALGESMRIVVLNSGNTVVPPAATFCRPVLQFYDAQGQLIKQKAVADLAPGTADLLDVGRSELPGLDRAEIRGVVKTGYSGGAQPPPAIPLNLTCNLLVTLEIFDSNTGRTILASTDSKPLPGPTVPLQ